MTVRKDKLRGKHTMGDQLKEDQLRAGKLNPLNKQQARIDAEVQPSRYTKEYMEQVARYNENVTILDKAYTGLHMVGSLLVRCYMYEIEVSPSGLIEPINAMIDIKTPSGGTTAKEVEITVPYSLKAVVVSVPENYPATKPGTIVQLKPGTIHQDVVGDSKGYYINPRNSFSKIGKYQQQFITDITSPDYGYVTINYSDIQCILEVPNNVEQD